MALPELTSANPHEIVIFESITPAFYPILSSYINRRYTVLVFDFTWDLKRRKYIRNLINTEKLKRIFIPPNNPSNGQAIDLAEIVYGAVEKGGMIKLARSLYGSDEIGLLVKKELAKNLFRYLFINTYLCDLKQTEYSADRVIFIPEKYLVYENIVKRFGNIKINPIGNVEIPKRYASLSKILSHCFKVKYLAGSALYAFSFAAALIWGKAFGKPNPPPKKFNYAIDIGNLFQVKFAGRRGFDFLIDGEHIRKEKSVFLLNIPIDKAWIIENEKRGFQFFGSLRIFSKRNIMHTSYRIGFIFRAIHAIIRSGAHINDPDYLFSAFYYAVVAFVRFHMLTQNVRFENYVYSNNETTTQLAMNALFRKNGTSSWCYLAFWVGGYPRSRGISFFINHRNIIWSHLNPDYMVCINNDMIQYFKIHHQRVGKYLSFGSIYSEMVKDAPGLKMRDILLKECFHIRSATALKICAFFDTTFIDDVASPVTVSEGISFYKDIERLLESRNDLLIIIKPSKDEQFYTSPDSQWYSKINGKRLVSFWTRLQNNPRVFFAGDRGDIVTIMAGSDLIVTHCMSSTTGEALGARKKAIWYESGDKHRGMLYDQIPGLVVHGVSQLESKINEMLYEISDEDYNQYLDHFVLGKVEANLDGKALSRFRESLECN